jgi:hypothetical protein
MYEQQDYVMRMIHEMVRTLLKLLFNIDADSPSTQLLQDDSEAQDTLDSLLDLIDEGQINEAENRLYGITSENRRDLEIALIFYSYLNDKTDDFLEEHDFSRREIKEGLLRLAEMHGIRGYTDIFFRVNDY